MGTPVITQLVPPDTVLGYPSFELHVRGHDFEEGCFIVWNGGDEPTTFVSSTLVTTGVNMATAVTPVMIPIEVRNPGGELSNTAGFTFWPSDVSAWPGINDLAEFTKTSVNDPTLTWSLNAAVTYGIGVLGTYTDPDGNVVPFPPNDATFQATLDYAGSLYTQRIGQADFYTNPEQGSTPQQRYRRILLASRYVAIA